MSVVSVSTIQPEGFPVLTITVTDGRVRLSAPSVRTPDGERVYNLVSSINGLNIVLSDIPGADQNKRYNAVAMVAAKIAEMADNAAQVTW